MKIDKFVDEYFYWILAAIVAVVIFVYRKELFPTLNLPGKVDKKEPLQDAASSAGNGLDVNKTLQKGSTGPEVVALQKALNKLGANPKLTEDGNFGAKTESSLLLFAGITKTSLKQFTALTGEKI